MNTETVLGILAILLTVLTLLVSILGVYLAYLSRTLESRIHSRLSKKSGEASRRLEALFRAQLALVDAAVCVAAEAMLPSDGRHEGTELLYFLRHAIRLSSDEPGEISLALNALDAAGEQAIPLYPYVERIRSSSSWPSELEQRFEGMMKKAIAKD